MHEELAKVIPSFIRRSALSHHTNRQFSQFTEAMQTEMRIMTAQNTQFEERSLTPGVRLIDYDADSVVKVAAALLFTYSNKGLLELQERCRKLPQEELARILDAGCSARENRRQKSPRALEHANFTFEILADFGVYRDLHRHRLLTQERQLLSCDYGFWTPDEIVGTELEEEYVTAMQKAKEVYDTISKELPEEAQYVVPMGYNIRWYFQLNLRALQWICELRSSAAGHPGYRFIAQEMAKQVCQAMPRF